MNLYRGKHEGKTRGKYKREALKYVPNNLADAQKVEDELFNFLGDKGIVMINSKLRNDGPYEGHEYAFHIAGATVEMMSFYYDEDYYNTGGSGFFSNPNDPSRAPQYSINLKLVSNDSLDDVIQKITDSFPILKKTGY